MGRHHKPRPKPHPPKAAAEVRPITDASGPLADRRTPNKDPQARIPIWVLRSEEWAQLVERSPLAAHLYLLLRSYAGPMKQTAAGTWYTSAWCSGGRLADMAGTWRRSVVRAMDVLEERGWTRKVARTERGQPVDLRAVADGGEIPDPEKGDGARLANEYVLLEPGEAGKATAAAQAWIAAKNGGQPCSHRPRHPLLQDVDTFEHQRHWHLREARVGQPLLASSRWVELRARPAAMRVYLLLAAYAPIREWCSYGRLMRELHIERRASIREAWAALEAGSWVSRVARTFDGRQARLANGYELRDLSAPPALAREGSRRDAAPAALAAPSPPASSAVAEELVKAFHLAARGVPCASPRPGELRFAGELLAGGEDLARWVVEYSLREIRRTRWAVATFNAIKAYRAEAESLWKSRVEADVTGGAEPPAEPRLHYPDGRVEAWTEGELDPEPPVDWKRVEPRVQDREIWLAQLEVLGRRRGTVIIRAPGEHFLGFVLERYGPAMVELFGSVALLG